MENEKSDVDAILQAIPTIVSRLDIEPFTLFLSELLGRNQALGLMSKQSSIQIASKLIEMSVNMWDFLQKKCDLPETAAGIRVIDIGSGGGFPGIVWKLLNPELEGVLLERKGRRVDFLQRLVLLLKFENISVVEGDIHQIARQQMYNGMFNVATMLAVAPPEALACPIEMLLKPAGLLCSVKSRWANDIPEALSENMQLVNIDVTDKATLFAYRKVI